MKFYFPLLSWVAISVAFSICSCTAQPPFQLSGQIELDPAYKPIVYLVQPRHFNEIAADYLGLVIDSAAISPEGHFSFDHLALPGDKMLVTLVVQKKDSRFGNHLADEIPTEANYMPLVLAKGHPMVIQAKAGNFQKTFIPTNPSADNEAMLALRDARLDAHEMYASQAEEASDADSMLLEREEAHQRYTGVMSAFADQTNSLEAAMVAIRWVSPNGDFERMPEFLHGQCKKWSTAQPENSFTVELCAAADKNVLPVMVGDVMPDFPMPLVSGDTVMLLSLLGNRLTIVDVWASWCAPCRKENRVFLAPLYASYKDKGLEIIAYSIDNGGESWKKAITKDQACMGTCLSPHGRFHAFYGRALRISTIPANYILDANGKVVAKNVYGEAIAKFRQGIFKVKGSISIRWLMIKDKFLLSCFLLICDRNADPWMPGQNFRSYMA